MTDAFPRRYIFAGILWRIRAFLFMGYAPDDEGLYDDYSPR